MVNVIVLEELGEHIGSKHKAIVSIEQTRWSVLGDDLLQVHG